MADLRTETRAIGDLQISIMEYPALRNLSLVGRLMRTCGPALLMASGDQQADVKTLGPAAEMLFRSLTPEELVWWAKELLASAWAVIAGKRVELGSEQAINLVFSGKVGLLLETMRFSLEVNCTDFFSWLRAQLGRIGEARALLASSESNLSSEIKNSKISSLSGVSG